MTNINYVGIKTESEAKRVAEEFVQKTKEENKQIRADRNIAMLITFVVGAIIAGIVAFCLCPERKQDILGLSACILFGIEFAVFMTYHDEMLSTEEWAWPVAYQFWKKTKGLTLLKSELRYDDRSGKKDLWLTLKNGNNEVSHEFVNGFKSITRTDIKDTIVNLDEGVVYEPYKDYGF